MSVLDFLVYENGSQKRKNSASETVQFAAIQVGTTPLQISEALGAFDFGAKKLSNLLNPVATSDAATKDYVDVAISTAGGGKANISLNNLTTTAINAALLPGTAFIDLASNSLAFRDLYVQNIKNGSNTVVDVMNRRLRDGTNLSVDLVLRQLFDSSGVALLDWATDIKIGKPSAVVPVKFTDSDASNHVGFQAPAVVPSNVMWTLPSTDAPVSGYVLSSNAAGVLSWIDPGVAGPTEFADDVFRITDNVTPTKKIAFEASAITAATTRTITMPDADVDLGNLALRTLNNLTTTSINAALLPSAAATWDIGSSLLPWDDIWARTLTSDVALAINGTADLDLTSLNAAVNITAFTNVVIDTTGGFVLPGTDDNITLGSASFHWAKIFVNEIEAATDLVINSPIDMTNKKITNLATPTLANDAATKAYVDAASGGDWKYHCRVASDTALSFGGVHPLVIGGVTLEFGDRILVKDQTQPEDNGIYDYNDAGGGNYNMTRSLDMSTAAQAVGAVSFVSEGLYARVPFYQRTPHPAAVSQVESWDFTGLTGASFDVVGAGLKLNLGDGLGYLWFNVTDGLTQTDPGGTGASVQVDILLADSATAIANAADAALTLAALVVSVTSIGAVLEATYFAGALASPGDAGDSGTTFSLVTTGSDSGFTLGTDPVVWSAFGSSSKVEYRTLSAGEITAKQITLVQTPNAPTEVALDVIGGAVQFYGDDFTVTGNLLGWSGLGLDGVLIAGDKVRVMYHYY